MLINGQFFKFSNFIQQINYALIFSIFTAQTFSSEILVVGASASFLNLLADSIAKWKGIKTTPSATTSDTLALTFILPRLDETETNYFNISHILLKSFQTLILLISDMDELDALLSWSESQPKGIYQNLKQ